MRQRRRRPDRAGRTSQRRDLRAHGDAAPRSRRWRCARCPRNVTSSWTRRCSPPTPTRSSATRRSTWSSRSSAASSRPGSSSSTALKAGKPVVTANKELLANVGAELFAAADAAGVDLLFEAAVAGGIPIMRPLRESLVGERVTRVHGHRQRHDQLHPHPDDRGGRRATPSALAEAQAPRLRRGGPDRRRRGLRRRGQGRHHRHHRVRRTRSSPATSTTRASRRSPPTDIDFADPPRLRRQAAGDRRAVRRRRLGRGAGPPGDGADRPSARRGARQLQRGVRRGRRGRRPHVLRPGRRRRAHRVGAVLGDLIDAASTCARGRTPRIGTLRPCGHAPDRRALLGRTT